MECPKKCSYGEHLHIFQMGVESVDHAEMERLRRKIEASLIGCKK